MTILQYTVPLIFKISSTTDRNFCHFGLFLSFYSLTIQKIKILKEWKKHLEISSFYTNVPKIMIMGYTVPEICHVMDVTIFHLDYFLPFYPCDTAGKMKISNKFKKHLEILSFYTNVPKIMIICYNVPEIWCVMDVIVIFHFGLYFTLLQPKFYPSTLWLPKKWKYPKNDKKKKNWRYDNFAQV